MIMRYLFHPKKVLGFENKINPKVQLKVLAKFENKIAKWIKAKVINAN
jgi:hypothetical protein